MPFCTESVDAAMQDKASVALHALASHLPPNLTITSLSISHPPPETTKATGNPFSTYQLAISRCHGTSSPLLMTIPIPLHTGDYESGADAEQQATAESALQVPPSIKAVVASGRCCSMPVCQYIRYGGCSIVRYVKQAVRTCMKSIAWMSPGMKP